MKTRFDVNTYPLLRLLAKAKNLDKLLLIEPEKAPEVDQLLSFLKEIDKRGTPATPLERKTIDELDKIVKSYHAEMNRYFHSKSHLPIGRQTEQQLAELPDQDAVDEIFMTHRPRAYFIPESTQSTILKTGNDIFKKLAGLLPDMPTETAILIFTPWNHAELSCQFHYHISSKGVTGVLIQHLKLDNKNAPRVTNVFAYEFGPEGMTILDPASSPRVVDESHQFFIMALLFIYFFETETVVVTGTPNASHYNRETLNENHYESNLGYPVNIIDAHWYTTIIRDDPFLVRGHFRRQPYGPGRSQYKIRWIPSFMKHGYHCKALNQ